MAKNLQTENKISVGNPLKVTLVRLSRDYKESLADQPLGLMYLGAYIRFRAGCDVKIHDFKLGPEVLKQLEADLRERRPQIVGLGAMTYESTEIPGIIKRILAIRPDATIVVGGTHASVFPDSVLKIPGVDFVVKGEGEQTFLELIAALESGGDLKQVPGIAFNSDSNPYHTDPRPPLMDLDQMPFPAWDMIDVERYFDLLRAGIIIARREYMALFTSRSCAYRCIYCHNIFGHVYRARSAENVVREMGILYERYGIREFQILDDAFNLDLERTKKICRMMIERGIKVKMCFPNGLRGDRLDDETVELLAAAGMYRTQYSVETASPRMQKIIKKYMNLEKIKHNIEYTSKQGVMTHGAFMLGFPEETREEILQTVDFALNSSLDTAAFYRVIPFQGTELYDMVKHRISKTRDLDNYEYYTHDVNISMLSDEELTRIQKCAYRKFYLSPRRIFRVIMKLPRKILLFRLFGIFLRRAWQR